MNNKTLATMMTIAIALFGFYAKASIEAHEGRAVYHSSCGISENPVRFERTSGKNNKWRKWIYRDTVTNVEIKADRDQHEACESVKVLMSDALELAEATRLKSVENQWLLIVLAWFGFMVMIEVATSYLAKRRERLEWEETKRQMDLEHQRECEKWQKKRKAEEAERLRSKTANEERARRKAERGAILEARRLANLERKKG
jgi:RNA polymerase subunit RPABC4/transcription elongation factor Spt4